MENISKQLLHIYFLPFMAHGHMIPAIDMAKLFASHGGVKVSIITTPLNVPYISKYIENSGFEIGIKTIRFPYVEAGLPEGCENEDSITSQDEEEQGKLRFKLLKASELLQHEFEKLLEDEKDDRPDCVVSDMLYLWATDSAAKFGIPRLVIHLTSFFSLCASESLIVYKPFKGISSDTELFSIPNFPSDIQLTRMQLPPYMRDGDDDSDFFRVMKIAQQAELNSFGVVCNTFYELEPEYADHYTSFLGRRRAWTIGPLSLSNQNSEENKENRGKQASVECLKWLDSKKPDSVVYVCFGSMVNFKPEQLKELAMALEASGQKFIWVVKKEAGLEWLPEGFEERNEGNVIIIRGWAPQVLILDHESVGGFVTHCGWNSTLEAISAGVPMVTWPVSAEQFYNEKLITQVLEIGVSVGVREWTDFFGDSVDKKAIELAVKELMVGENAEQMRNKAKSLGEMAKKAVQQGGSSYSNVETLLDELRKIRR